MTFRRFPLLATAASLALGAAATAAPLAAQTPATAPAAASAAAPKSTAPLPEARTLLDRYAKAVGGRDALAKHSSMHQTAVLEFAGAGIKADLHIFTAKPNRMLTRMTIPGMGDISRGYDGTTGWSIEPTSGPMILGGKQLDQMRIESDFMGMMHDPKNYVSTQTVGLVDFEGKPAYEVRLVRAGADTATEYFDPQTGLMVGLVRSTESAMGRMTVTGTVADYKPFGGLLLPTHLTQRLATGQQMSVTVSAVEFDAVPANTFELPAPIKALAAAAPPAAAPATATPPAKQK